MLHGAEYATARDSYRQLVYPEVTDPYLCPFCEFSSEKAWVVKRHIKMSCVVRLQTCLIGFPDQARAGIPIFDSAIPAVGRVHHVCHAVHPASQRTTGGMGRTTGGPAFEEVTIRRRVRGKQQIPRVQEEAEQALLSQHHCYPQHLGPTCATTSSPCPTPRRTTSGSCSQHLLHSTPRSFKTGSCANLDQRKQAMEDHLREDTRADQRESPRLPLQGIAGSSSYPQPISTQRGQGLRSTLPDRKRTLLRTDVGHIQGAACGAQERTDTCTGPTPDTLGRDCNSDQLGVDRKDESSEAVRESCLRHGYAIHDHNVCDAPSWPETLFSSCAFVQYELLGFGGCKLPERERKVDRPCREPSQTDLPREEPRQLRLDHAVMSDDAPLGLVNMRNLCYANSYAQGLSWCVRQADLNVQLPVPWDAALLALQHRTACSDLLSLPGWHELVHGWEFGRHEDVAEFATYVQSRAPLGFCDFDLVIRRSRLGHNFAFSSETTCMQMLTLPISTCGSLCGINELLANWCMGGPPLEHVVHGIALRRPPRLLLIQLSRFRFEEGRVIKVRSPVQIDHHIRVPTWSSAEEASLEIESTTYRVAAVVKHHGIDANSGHYTAWLLDASGSHAWHCDDSVRPRLVTMEEMLGAVVLDACLVYLIAIGDA